MAARKRADELERCDALDTDCDARADEGTAAHFLASFKLVPLKE